MSVKLMNAIASAMDGKHGADHKGVLQTKPGKAAHKAGTPGDADGMSADHQDQGAGEGFGIDELEGKICKDCHDTVKSHMARVGGTRGEQA